MMPYQQPRGRTALKRLRVYLSVPDEFKEQPTNRSGREATPAGTVHGAWVRSPASSLKFEGVALKAIVRVRKAQDAVARRRSRKVADCADQQSPVEMYPFGARTAENLEPSSSPEGKSTRSTST